MAEPQRYRALARSIAALADAGVMPMPAVALERKLADTARLLRDTVLAEVADFSASGNPEVLPELERHAGEHVGETRRLLRGGALGDFGFVAAHAQRCAEWRFPLEAVLHAYRCGHKVLAHWLRDAVTGARRRNTQHAISALADFAIEYTNTVSTIATSDYVARSRALAEAEGDRRNQLLNILLAGFDEADGRVARQLKQAGYLDQRLSFCVALVRAVEPQEMGNPARAQRIVDALSGAVAALPLRVLIGVRDQWVVAIVSGARRLSGWTAPQSGVADRVYPCLQLLGPSVLVGLSGDQPSTAFIPRALQEATVALDVARVDERVVRFASLPIRRLLLHRGVDYVQSALPPWLDALDRADAKVDGALLRTVRALADADMNLQQAARALGAHPNTVYTRVQRVHDLTGLDCQRYHDLTELLLAVDCRVGRS